jgi:solute carrier family 25 folate transporter 32
MTFSMRWNGIADRLVMESKLLSHVISAICGGASSTLCTNPIWVIKTRLMSQTAATASTTPSPYHYRSTIDAARKMYTHEGLRSFYSGLAPALLGLTHVGVQFPAYEFLKGKFTGGIELGKQGADGSSHWGGILAASVLSKVCATSATYPHEVLRTRLQTQRILNGHAEKSGLRRESSAPRYRGILHSAGTIYREEGWRAFYSGMGTNMVRAVPSSAITLLTYEREFLLELLWQGLICVVVVNGFLTRLREESIEYHGHR